MRTIKLGMRSIDHLLSESVDVTFSNIARKSKAIDPEGRGIHQNTIRTNTELYEYYKKNSKTYKKAKNTRRKKEVTEDFSKTDFSHIKLDRDLQTVRIRYKQMTKAQLIDRLISAEQYIANSNNVWLIKQFESFPIT
ncbi:hypothetical protein [Paenibacillus polymyxa]|uniref:hypothetical protein n=2 Tax=Paenibacillus TaxID=44249 RepID=UPI0025B6BDC1|nr:hypothetical protein [Paenibacillus polymyxa]